jgi:hypothetical protein
MSRSDEHTALADELRQRIKAGDVAGVDALYHDDAIVWRNIDNRELVKKQMLRVIEFLTKQVSELRYEDVRVPGGEGARREGRPTRRVSRFRSDGAAHGLMAQAAPPAPYFAACGFGGHL